MASNSEVSYGARIGNAEKLVAALQNFSNYQPIKPEYSIANYTQLIDETKTLNNTVAEKKQAYSLAVDNRQQIFDKGATSISKILAPINGMVKGSFGRTSKEATDVAAIIEKLRGRGRKKAPVKPDEETVSQSYQSYNSQTQYFADLIVNLTNFGSNYEPANATLKIPALNTLYADAVTANGNVMNTFTQFTQNNDTRLGNYNQLSQTAIRIKDSIKSQYGAGSVEYKLIKGLRI